MAKKLTTTEDLITGYKAMAADEQHEKEALEWAEATIADVSDDPPLLPNSIQPATLAEWRAWLEANHQRKEGVWLVSRRRAAGPPPFTYVEAVEEALCYGWIDGQAKTLDQARGMQWYAPRRAGSTWVKSNKERVARLIEQGRMTPAGLAKIEAAQANGSWSLLESAERLEVPDDLAAALAGYADARAHFDAFPPSARQMILAWIAQAKRPETRARRVAETARLAQENVRANERRPETKHPGD